MKTKRHYTSPVTRRATVELEGGFCGSIYGSNKVKANEHETGFDNVDGGDSFKFVTSEGQTDVWN